MKSSYICTRPANVVDIYSNNAEIGVLGYEILDSGRHTAIGYLVIWIPVEIISSKVFRAFIPFECYYDISPQEIAHYFML